MSTRTTMVLLAGLLLPVLVAPAAHAETVRLRSGKVLQVEQVRFLAGRIDVTLRRAGGTVRVVLPFERVDGRNLLALWDRTMEPQDGVQVLRGARLALRLDLRGEAAKRLRAAAQLDPALADERDAGLASLRALESAERVAELETRVRAGGAPQAALAFATALLEGPQAEALSAAQRLRVEALRALARSLLARSVRREADAAAVAALPEPGPVPAAGAPAQAMLADRIAVHETKARVAREAAADPKTSPRRAIRHLETAARALLAARRHVREAPAALAAGLTETDERLRLGIVATYLELADLFRQEGRFDRARAYLRAVLLLDPGSEDAWAQRELVEEDLRRASLRRDDPYGSGFESYSWSPSPFCRTYRAAPFGLVRYDPRHHGGVHVHGLYRHGSFRVHLGAGHAYTPGARRVIGRRR